MRNLLNVTSKVWEESSKWFMHDPLAALVGMVVMGWHLDLVILEGTW